MDYAKIEITLINLISRFYKIFAEFVNFALFGILATLAIFIGIKSIGLALSVQELQAAIPVETYNYICVRNL